jgi:hypothetical protein
MEQVSTSDVALPIPVSLFPNRPVSPNLLLR